MSIDEAQLRRLYWQARRGMLELDSLFRAYLDRHGRVLTPQQYQTLEAIFHQPDPVLFDVFRGAARLPDAGQQAMFEAMLER